MRTLALACLALLAASLRPAAAEPSCDGERATMMDAIRAQAQSVTNRPLSQRVLTAMAQTPRQLFMLDAGCANAYANRAASIGHGQTISQPLVVALMTDLASVDGGDSVLEVGTGLGYQAAILSRLARRVCTIEIIGALADAATVRLKEIGRDNVSVRTGDGYRGWPECGPFDSIIVTAAPGEVPPPLIEQLKVGGRLIMPVGSPSAIQELTVVEKIASGQTTTRTVVLARPGSSSAPGK